MFRFSIRELFLVTLVVAMGIAWCLDHRKQTQETTSWRRSAGGLELVLQQEGWLVHWGQEWIWAERRFWIKGAAGHHVRRDTDEPGSLDSTYSDPYTNEP